MTLPIERQGKFAFEFGDTLLEVDPQAGARISKLQLAGQELLTGPDVDATNWGSTFWPSPQARWNWPPVPELDSQPYTGGVMGQTVMLTSAVGMRAKVSVTKLLQVDLAARAIDLQYTLTNADQSAASWAGWEVTRVAPKGLTFFPTGQNTVSGGLPVLNMDGVTWYQHDPASVSSSGQKWSGDGSGGWLAHVAGRMLFLKKFADVPPAMQAPAPEAEIAIYAVPSYVELEPQGPYTALAPGQSLHWSVRWYVRKLPDDIDVQLGSAALVKFAQSLAAQ